MTPTPDTDEPRECSIPPEGWYCTRQPGHDGPCAAHPNEWQGELNANERAEIDASWERYKARIASTRPADSALGEAKALRKELREWKAAFLAGEKDWLYCRKAWDEERAELLALRQPAPRADDALREALEFYAGLGECPHSEGKAPVCIWDDGERARAALASEEPTGPVCTLCGLTLKGD